MYLSRHTIDAIENAPESQRVIAKRFAISESTLSGWKTGKYVADVERAYEVAAYLGVPRHRALVSEPRTEQLSTIVSDAVFEEFTNACLSRGVSLEAGLLYAARGFIAATKRRAKAAA